LSTCLHLHCDGCGAETNTVPIRKRFESVSGRSHGFGSWRPPDIDDAVAEGCPGWVWSDPYTRCTYCPECWGQIETEDP
jgi:hypothetical protein